MTEDAFGKLILDAMRRFFGSKWQRNEDVPDTLCPIFDLGLQSADGVDLALELELILSVDIDDGLNPLVDDERHRPRTVGEIVRWAANLKERQNGKGRQQTARNRKSTQTGA